MFSRQIRGITDTPYRADEAFCIACAGWLWTVKVTAGGNPAHDVVHRKPAGSTAFPADIVKLNAASSVAHYKSSSSQELQRTLGDRHGDVGFDKGRAPMLMVMSRG